MSEKTVNQIDSLIERLEKIKANFRDDVEEAFLLKELTNLAEVVKTSSSGGGYDDTEVKNSISNLDLKIESFVDDLTTIEDEASNALSETRTITNRINEIMRQLNPCIALGKETSELLTSLTDRVTALESSSGARMGTMENRISEDSKTVGDKLNELFQGLSKLNTLESNNETLSKKITELESDNAELKTKVAALEAAQPSV